MIRVKPESCAFIARMGTEFKLNSAPEQDRMRRESSARRWHE